MIFYNDLDIRITVDGYIIIFMLFFHVFKRVSFREKFFLHKLHEYRTNSCDLALRFKLSLRLYACIHTSHLNILNTKSQTRKKSRTKIVLNLLSKPLLNSEKKFSREESEEDGTVVGSMAAGGKTVEYRWNRFCGGAGRKGVTAFLYYF